MQASRRRQTALNPRRRQLPHRCHLPALTRNGGCHPSLPPHPSSRLKCERLLHCAAGGKASCSTSCNQSCRVEFACSSSACSPAPLLPAADGRLSSSSSLPEELLPELPDASSDSDESLPACTHKAPNPELGVSWVSESACVYLNSGLCVGCMTMSKSVLHTTKESHTTLLTYHARARFWPATRCWL
jgi:hypothetical protein